MDLWRFNPADFFRLLPGAGERCAYCGGAAGAVDHVVPLSRGGGDDPWNWAPACRSCNASKGAREVRSWLARTGRSAELFDAWLEVRDSFLRRRRVRPDPAPVTLTLEVVL